MTGAPPANPVPVNVGPPAPVMPGMNNQFQRLMNGSPGVPGTLNDAPTPGAGATAVKGLMDAGSGVDVQSMFANLKSASDRMNNENQAKIEESMGAGGMRFSTDTLNAVTDFRLQSQKDLASEYDKLQMGNEALKLQANQSLFEGFGNAAMTYAPTQVVAGGGGYGASPFQQASQAVTGGAMAAAAIMMALAM